MSRPANRRRPPLPTRPAPAATHAGSGLATQRSAGTYIKGVGSLVLLLGFVVGVPYVLAQMGAYPTSVPNPGSVWQTLTGPDLNGRSVFTAITGLIWVGWVWFTLSVLRETADAVFTLGHPPRSTARAGVRRPVRSRTWSVQPAAVLVAAVAAMFITTPLLAANSSPALASPSGTPGRPGIVATATLHAPGPVAASSGAPTDTATPPTAPIAPIVPLSSSSHQVSSATSAPTTSSTATRATYMVRRYDTLWTIAERQLGDPTRYQEIVALNPHLTPSMTIHAGDKLTLPQHGTDAGTSEASTTSQDPVVHETVEAGDTLSEISADHGVKDWRTVWAANEGKAEPGGKHLTNPDHIEVGWDITVPTTATTPAPASTAPASKAHLAPAAQTPAPAVQTLAAGSDAGGDAGGAAGLAVGAAAGAGKPMPNHRPDPQASEQPETTAPAATGSPTVADPDPPSPAAESPTHPSALQPGLGATKQKRSSRSAIAVGYAAGGAVLTAAMGAALVLVRRQQRRDRRPGRTVASTPEPLIPLERAIVTAGAPSAEETARIDQVLRRVAASDIPILHVAAVQLTHGDITVHLCEPAAFPAPWRQPTDTADNAAGGGTVSGDRRRGAKGHVEDVIWTFPADADPTAAGPDPSVVDAIAPFPTLVHIGSDATSGWLLNLEQAGTLVLTGDRDRCLALVRVMSAQLGLNAWADIVAVTMLGFGEELVETAPARLRHAPMQAADEVLASATSTASRTADAVTELGLDVVEARRAAAADEAWPVHVLLAADADFVGAADPPDNGVDDARDADTGNSDSGRDSNCGSVTSARMEELLRVVQQRAGRTGAVVVVVQGQAGVDDGSALGGALVASLDASGTMTLDGVGLTVQAVGWDDETSRGVGELMRHLRNAPDQAVPAAKGDKPWQQIADAAGALRPDLVAPRSTPTVHDSQQPAGATMLPLADQVYVDVAATTADDLQVLSPTVSSQVVERVLAADPTLDQDVADWFDPDCCRAKLSVLGPLKLRGQQQPPKRAPYFAELAAYLAFREHGATAEELMTAFSLSPSTSRNYLSTLRDLLGQDPVTGVDYMPSAKTNPVAKARGVGVYLIEGMLVDADLFRRLRVRGQARGPAGMEDFATALRLVTGAPFSQMRDDGGVWLLEGDRIDHHLSLAIVDVAHTLAISALAAGDTVAARAAVDIARQAAPDEETVRLDAAAVDVADGRSVEARRTLRDDVCNRSDDGEAPLELNARTRQILARHRDWLIAS